MAIYNITIEVTDDDITLNKLRWLLDEAGEVMDIKEEYQ